MPCLVIILDVLFWFCKKDRIKIFLHCQQVYHGYAFLMGFYHGNMLTISFRIKMKMYKYTNIDLPTHNIKELCLFWYVRVELLFRKGMSLRIKVMHRLKYVYHIKFNNPSARAGYDIRSIFKWNLTGFNSEFSFS